MRAPRAHGPRIVQAYARGLLAELAATRGGAAPAEQPTSKFPEISVPWLPNELVFGARRSRGRLHVGSANSACRSCAESSHFGAFGLSSPPDDQTLGPAPDMPGAP